MPGFFPGRPGGEHDEPLLDMLLERRPIPPGAPPEMHGLADMLAAVAGPAETGDLAGEAAALAAFTRLGPPAGTSTAARRSARHRLTERPVRGRLPLAAALAVAAAGLGSATAAYVGALPSPIQHFAHETIGAPPPLRDTSQRTLVVGSSSAAAPRQPGTPGSRRAHPSSTAPASSHPRDWRWRSSQPAYSSAPAFASCLPMPGPTQNQARSSPSPSPTPSAGNSSPGQLSASPGSLQSPGRSQPKRDQALPGSQASGWTPAPSATRCQSLPTPTPTR